MPTMAFDTHHAVKTIRAAGADEKLAEAIVKSLRPDTYEPDLSDLATKTDLAVIRTDLTTVESNLNAKIAAVEKSVATVDTKITMLMWMIGLLGLGAIVAQVLHNTHLL